MNQFPDPCMQQPATRRRRNRSITPEKREKNEFERKDEGIAEADQESASERKSRSAMSQAIAAPHQRGGQQTKRDQLLKSGDHDSELCPDNFWGVFATRPQS